MKKTKNESEVTNDSDDSDSDEDVNVNVNEINEHLKIMEIFKTRKNHHDYIKTPYPKLISFKDVFNLNKINSPQEDNEEEDLRINFIDLSYLHKI